MQHSRKEKDIFGECKVSIPASYIVDIIPRVISAGASGIEINGLFLTVNSQLPAGVVKEFVSSNAVAEYFGYESDEYNAAVVYFAGYQNSFKKPSVIKFASRVLNAVPAYLRGGKLNTTLEALKAVTDGSFNISIDSTAKELTGIDLSSCNSLSDVALKLQSAINTADITVTYSALNEGFQITSGTVGADSTISYAASGAEGTDLSSLLCLTSETGALISVGMEALSVAENMAMITGHDSNFVTITSLYNAEHEEALNLGKWSNSSGVSYCFIVWSNEASALMPDNNNDVVSVMSAAGITNFAGAYNSALVAAGIMGTFASVDWNRLNGAIDLAFKKVDGLAPTVTTESDAAALDKKTYTYMGKFATKNTEFNFLYKGTIVGNYINISTYINAVWFNETIKNALITGLSGVTKSTYNENGYSFIRAWMSDPINQALNNGVIQTGVTLSEAQKAQIISEVGDDITAELYANGYYLLIQDPGALARSTGESPVITLYYTDGGVVKKLQISSSVIM